MTKLIQLAEFLRSTSPVQTKASKTQMQTLQSKSRADDKVVVKMQPRIEPSMQSGPNCHTIRLYREKPEMERGITRPPLRCTPPSSADLSDSDSESDYGTPDDFNQQSRTTETKAGYASSNDTTPSIKSVTSKKSENEEEIFMQFEAMNAKLEKEVMNRQSRLFAKQENPSVQMEDNIASIETSSPPQTAPQVGLALTEARTIARLAAFRAQQEQIRNRQKNSGSAIDSNTSTDATGTSTSVKEAIVVEMPVDNLMKKRESSSPPRRSVPEYKRATVLLHDLDNFLDQVNERYTTAELDALRAVKAFL